MTSRIKAEILHSNPVGVSSIYGIVVSVLSSASSKIIHQYTDRTMQPLTIKQYQFTSRLFLGTGKFASNAIMADAIEASGSELVTVALKRIDSSSAHDELVETIKAPGVQLMPNTSGTHNADEAIFAARLAREAFGTDFIKVEIHPDPKYLLPDPFETFKATEVLAKEGFVVMPYIQADPILCKYLEDSGAAAVMPLGAPIGSNQGLKTKDLIRIIIEQSRVPVVVDAGLGAPSHAAEAMELGADAVLVNTAIASAGDPVAMARAFALATEAGRMAYESGLPTQCASASASSPIDHFFGF